MANFFGRAQYNCQTPAGTCGASEIYPMIQDSATAANNALGTLVVARLAMMVADVRCVYAGVSDSDIRGDFVPNTTLPDSVGTFAATDDDQTGPFTATRLIRFGNDDGTKRGLRQIRFLPVSQFNSANLIFSPSGDWVTAYNAWSDMMIATCCIATRLPGNTTPPFWTFTAITRKYDERDTTRRIGRPFELLVGRRVIR